MALDGISIAALTDEFSNKLIGARIDKIYQPQENLLTFRVRQPGENIKFLISADPQNPRINITNKDFENPQTPPNFCMLLRKYLQSGRIREVIQPEFERIIKFVIQLKNDSGELVDYTLLIELMGRHSNVILINEEKKVLDCIKHVTEKMSRHRELLPGKNYIAPPGQEKKNPLKSNWKQFKTTLSEQIGQPTYRAIMNSYRGIGPLMAIEISYCSGIDSNKDLRSHKEIEQIWTSFDSIFTKIKNKNFNPTLIIDNNDLFEAYAALNLKQHNDLKQIHYESISELLDFYFTEKLERKKYNRLETKLKKTLADNFDNVKSKRRKLKGQLKGAKNADKYKLKGELITANIYQMEQGAKKIKLENYYDDNKEITIELNPELKPHQNAEKYFKKYEKAKKSIKYLKIKLKRLKNEKIYLGEVKNSVKQATSSEELAEIYQELIEEGYISEQKQNHSKKDKKLPPLKFTSSDGYQILVGRNNKQNDHLTKKIANNQDTWLHVKQMPGSHTIIKNDTGKEIPEQTLYEAAIIASYYSKARNSKNIPIDYTKVKYVNKPKGVKPGLVNYKNYKTLYVDCDKSIVEKLRD